MEKQKKQNVTLYACPHCGNVKGWTNKPDIFQFRFVDRYECTKCGKIGTETLETKWRIKKDGSPYVQDMQKFGIYMQ